MIFCGTFTIAHAFLTLVVAYTRSRPNSSNPYGQFVRIAILTARAYGGLATENTFAVVRHRATSVQARLGEDREESRPIRPHGCFKQFGMNIVREKGY